MNKKNRLLTSSELFFILVGCIIGLSTASLPADVASISRQDAWISTIIGGLYPLYIVGVGGIIIKKYPDSNILNLSKAFLGKIIGNILNFLFMLQFLFYVVLVIAGASNHLRAYSVYFISHFKMVIILALVVCYASIKGLKVLSRVSAITFYLLCLVVITATITFRSASILNIKPFFGTGVSKILEGSIKSAFAYGNMELLLIIYPYVKEKKDILKVALISTLVIVTIDTWIVFTSIYFTGPDLVTKELLPFFFVAESFKIPVVNNFRFIDIIIWIMVDYKSMAIEYYASTKILNNITKIKRKVICYLLFPVILILPIFMENEILRGAILNTFLPWITIFNISFVTLISLLAILIDKNKLINKKGEKHINEKV